jgi:hypothetical protein
MEEERGGKRRKNGEVNAELEMQKNVLQAIIQSSLESVQHLRDTFQDYLETQWERQDPKQKEYVLDCTASAMQRHCDYHSKFLSGDKWKEQKEQDWPQ